MTLDRSPITTLRRVCDGLLVAVILVVLFGVVLGRVVPMSGRHTFIIGGGSMEPAIPLGAAVVVESVPAADLVVGDVVSLRTGPELKRIFTHRVTRIITRDDGLWVETKGDANAQVDPSITSTSQVIGRVTQTIPYAGFLLALLSVPSGVLLVILLAAFLLAMTWLLETFEVERLGPAPTGDAVGGPAVPRGTATTPAGSTARAARLRARRARRAGLVAIAPGCAPLSAATTSASVVPAPDYQRD